eukprot:Skav223760  [mRNA]  locus=scaffold4249:8626:10200:- [translate_table: standard]
MHPLQLRALQRGLQALVPGGKLVYFTQSGNCIENEAVVSACLRSQASNQVHLIPVSHESALGWAIDGWSTSDGIQSWSVPTPEQGCDFASWEEVPQRLRGGKILQTMFPPLEASELRRCLRATKGSNQFFAAIFWKSTRPVVAMEALEGELPCTVVAPAEPMLTPAPGTQVVVKTTGAPAVVVGPGQGAFKGLIKIRYPDRSTYHVELEHLEVTGGMPLKTRSFKLAAGIASLLIFLACRAQAHFRTLRQSSFQTLQLWLARTLAGGKPKQGTFFKIFLSFVVSFFLWRLLRRKQRLAEAPSSPTQLDKSDSRPSRLVKRCAKVPEPVQAFARFFGLELPRSPQHMGHVHLPNLCYRTLDKQTLYLVSPAIFELRVPELLRHSLCGMPFLQRCVTSQDLQRWGCELRPTTAAAAFLYKAGAQRCMRLPLSCWKKLLVDGTLAFSDLSEAEQMKWLDHPMKTWTPGAVILMLDELGKEVDFLSAVLQADRVKIFLAEKEQQERLMRVADLEALHSCIPQLQEIKL